MISVFSKKALVNLAVLTLSTGAALLLCEFGARLFLNPSDYLSVEMVKDDVLGAVPAPGSRPAGFDEWGFRNRNVPRHADIVAIGDSHTFGNTATMDDSWPAVVARNTGKSVYNLGMGGYGPNQYLYLLKHRALKLSPKAVIVGLYMGDDFENAYLMTYGLSHWTYLRRLTGGAADSNIWQTEVPVSWHKKVRAWLSRRSVVYQITVHGPLTGQFQGEIQIRNANRINSLAVVLDVPSRNVLEAFLPRAVFIRLDQSSAEVREGMRVCFEILREMKEVCRQGNIQFQVVVIPTKEMVFADLLVKNVAVSQRGILEELFVNERLARERLVRFLDGESIAHIDPLPDLQRSVGDKLYARTAADMHPGKNGYKVIGNAVSRSLSAVLDGQPAMALRP